jgi:hypothetical protein
MEGRSTWCVIVLEYYSSYLQVTESEQRARQHIVAEKTCKAALRKKHSQQEQNNFYDGR